MTKEISAKDVELYLLKNTDFFLTRESIVSELSFKHSPGKAESLLERQVRKLRNEQKDLLDSLSVFLSNASENEDLFSKSKALVLKVVTAEDEDALIQLMYPHLLQLLFLKLRLLILRTSLHFRKHSIRKLRDYQEDLFVHFLAFLPVFQAKIRLFQASV